MNGECRQINVFQLLKCLFVIENDMVPYHFPYQNLVGVFYFLYVKFKIFYMMIII
ncbi:hypothetical protein HMPREF0345_2798 [Enterococcus faecalis ATCC 29200]|nr:hypothetical protein HMPREF0345_2798 [Enterococcus faecalis ATCC 29200]